MSIDNFNRNRLPNNLNQSLANEENESMYSSRKRRYDDTTDLRKGLAIFFTLLIASWLFIVFLILLMNTTSLKLSDSVLITLLTTTTIQVLGMMYIILKDLFPGGDIETGKAPI